MLCEFVLPTGQVGDTPDDILAAVKAGAAGIGVLTPQVSPLLLYRTRLPVRAHRFRRVPLSLHGLVWENGTCRRGLYRIIML